MQIKSSLQERKYEKEDEATTTKSRLPNEDSRKDVTMMTDGESQTNNVKQLKVQDSIITEMVMPDDHKRKEQH